jgi:hypothetical protein
MWILQTSSVNKFNNTFSTLEQSRFLGVLTKTTVEEMLILAEKLYTSIIADKGWTGFGRVGKSTFLMTGDRTVTIGKSVFLIGDDGEIVADLPGNTDGSVCWQCGKTGHQSWQCHNKGGQGGGGGNGGGRAGGRRKGAARGASDNKAKSPKRIPPLPGDSHERNFNGITMYWCGTCTYWNTTHLTVNHKSANLAAVEGEPADETAAIETATDNEANRVTFYSNITKRMAGAGS